MRRIFEIGLSLVGLLILLVGCGAETGTIDGEVAVVVDEGGVGTSSGAIQVMVGSDDFALGQPRIPLILFDGPEAAMDVTAVTVEAFLLGGEEPALLWTGEAVGYQDYKVPYWVVYPQLTAVGNWGLGLTMTRADGSQAKGSVVLAVAAETVSPALGTIPPASQNRILADGWTVAELSSDPTVAPGLYQMTVAEALLSGRPTVVTVATPAYCTSTLCAPVVATVEAVYEKVGAERANFIHLEVYQTFDPLQLAPELDEWGLKSEPWTFVLNREGEVTARFGGPIAVSELEAALAEAGL